MKIYNSIYDLKDLTAEEEDFALENGCIENMRFNRYRKSLQYRLHAFLRSFIPHVIFKYYADWAWNKLINKLYAPKTKEEYFNSTTLQKRYEDLFYVFRMRGDFAMAREYELLSGIDAVRMHAIPHDVIMKNELEYYDWRRRQL